MRILAIVNVNGIVNVLLKIQKILIVLFFLITGFVQLNELHAAEKKKENVLDFEADVIEGDRKRPDLFLEIKGQDLDLEGLLYLRNNFNDFYIMSKPTHYHFVKKK